MSNHSSVFCSSWSQKPEIKCGWGSVPTALPVNPSCCFQLQVQVGVWGAGVVRVGREGAFGTSWLVAT